MHRIVTLAASVALTVAGAAALGASPAGADTAVTPGAYVPVSTHRIASAVTVQAHGAVRVKVGASVPSDASAVVVSLSLTAGSRAGTLAASAGNAQSAPKIATVSYTAGQNIGDLAVVPLDSSHELAFWSNADAALKLTFDLSGYYTGGTVTSGGAFEPEPGSAVRVADTRTGSDGVHKGAVPAGHSVYPRIAGTARVPADASAVAATVTVVGATGTGTVSVRTSGGSGVPATIQVQAGRQVSQMAIVALSTASGGAVAISNNTGKPVQIAVDVSGWYGAGSTDSASTTQALESSTVSSSSIGARASTKIVLAGHGGVPRTGVVAAVVTVRVVRAATYGTVSATGGTAPTVVQFSTGSTRSGVVIAPVVDGAITVSNHSSKAATVQVDVDGYVPGSAVPDATVTSVAHYLNNLKGTSGDQTTMRSYADGDAAAGVQFVLFDVGSQSVHAPLTKNYPGVALALTDPVVRITYAKLVGDIRAYIEEFEAASENSPVEVAVATNNDGDFDPNSSTYYAPDLRGQAWATKVITPLRSALPAGVTVNAADDIEYGFSSTETQARTWENSYQAALPPSASGGVQLIYNGDANSCPRTSGMTGRTCTPGWTQADYYALAYSHGHVQVLPQIFFGYEAAKWANIDRTGNGTSPGGGLSFAGALTDHSRDRSHLDATSARAALYRALSAWTSTPRVPAAVDFG